MQIHEDEAFNARFPAERWARARLHLDSGEAIESADCEARGNPDTPLSDDELLAKYQALAEPVIGKRAARLRDVVMSLASHPAGDLLALLSPP